MLLHCSLLVFFLLLPSSPPQPAGSKESGASRANEVLVRLKGPKQGLPVERFVLREEEINAWTAVALADKRRLGVRQLSFDFLGAGRFLARVLVDMDEVEVGGIAVALFQAVLSGEQRLEVEGVLEGDKGKARYRVESARFNGISVPAWLAGRVIAYLGKSQPPHVDVTRDFDLPFGVQSVRITPDELVIVR